MLQINYSINYSDTARKALKKLDRQSAQRILDYMDERVATAEDPRSLGKPLKGTLADLWRYRVGDYRILCHIHDGELQVLVLKIGNRREVYR